MCVRRRIGLCDTDTARLETGRLLLERWFPQARVRGFGDPRRMDLQDVLVLRIRRRDYDTILDLRSVQPEALMVLWGERASPIERTALVRAGVDLFLPEDSPEEAESTIDMIRLYLSDESMPPGFRATAAAAYRLLAQWHAPSGPPAAAARREAPSAVSVPTFRPTRARTSAMAAAG